ncbi:MAG TPA: ATP-binding cassette domain-containing protein, partial [Fibrobacteria bacterium]|nr:ATP-binding cassette domain-containing protein [Fibrobacteria bacterium]
MTEPDLTPILVRGLVAGYGPTPVLDGVDLVLERGRKILLLGPNGAGKTTLFRCLLGLLSPTRGEVRLWGRDPADPIHRRALVSRCGVSLESPRSSLRVTAMEWTLFHASLAGSPDPSATAHATLERWEIPADRMVDDLSLGERQRLETSRALLHDPDLLVLDEPTAHLDPGARDKFWKCLDDWCEPRGASVLVSTHHLEEAADRGDEWIVLGKGKILHRGSSDAFLEANPCSRRLILSSPIPLDLLQKQVAGAVTGAKVSSSDTDGLVFRLSTPNGRRDLPAIVNRLSADGVEILGVGEDGTSFREAYARCLGSDSIALPRSAPLPTPSPTTFRDSVSAAFRLHTLGLARERRLLIPFAVMLGILLVAAIWIPQGTFPASLLALGAVLPGGLAAGLASDLVAGERDRRYLETSLCLPATFSHLVLGRAMAIAVFALALSWISLLSLAAACGAWLESLAIGGLLAPAAMAFCVGLGAWVSVRGRSLRTAAQLSTLATLPLIA